jgi:N-acetylglucosamine kinase-like BadF-type ATPase
MTGMQPASRQTPSRHSALLGLDVGGTKTHLRVERDGEAVDRVFPTATWRDPLDPADLSNLAVLAAELREAGGGDARSPLGVGAHGCDSPRRIEELASALRSVHPGPVVVVNDADLLVPAAGHERGIAVIAGTGSIVVGRDSAGGVIATRGFGWLLDDPGSAASIAREAVRSVFEQVDRAGDAGGLGRRLFDHFGVTDAHELSDVFTQRAGITLWADLAPLVFEVAAGRAESAGAEADVAAADTEAADAATAVIVADAERLAAGVELAVARGAVGTAIVAAGGVVTNQPLLERALSDRLARTLPGHSFTVLREAPVAGAVELARRLARSN